MDILPTMSRLCEAVLPKNPPDGIDIGPRLAGQKSELEREALLCFDNVDLQCARWKQWKLQVARYNSAVYGPAPAGGPIDLLLPAAARYDVVSDPEEIYDVAPGHPEVVAEIRSRIQRLIQGFPDGIRRDYEETMAKRVSSTAVGDYPALSPVSRHARLEAALCIAAIS